MISTAVISNFAREKFLYENFDNIKFNTIFAETMNRYKVREVLELLKEDGWYIIKFKGDHRQLKNNNKSGKVTVNGKLSDNLSQELLNSIWKQAG